MPIESDDANEPLARTVDRRLIVIPPLQQRFSGHFVTISQHALALPRSVGMNTALPDETWSMDASKKSRTHKA